MNIAFSPLSSTRTRSRRKDLVYPLLLLVAIVTALLGWVKVYDLQAELSDAQASAVQAQSQLATAQQSLADAQAKLSAPPTQPAPVALPVYPEMEPSGSTPANTNASGQPKPAHSGNSSTQANHGSSPMHSGNR